MTMNGGFIGATMMVAACFASTCPADVRLASLFGDGMVLQRDIQVPVWGWAEPGEQVSVSFAGQTASGVAAADGRWRVVLAPLGASKEPAEMSVTGSSGLVVTNVLVGDVWICSGQSNMQMPVSQVLHQAEEVAAADHPLVRLVTVPRVASDFLVDDVDLTWKTCTPETVASFSATAYFFARHLHRELDVPVGVVDSSWGGTQIAPWTAPAGFQQVPAKQTLAIQVASWDSSTESGGKNWRAFLDDLRSWQTKAEKAVEARAPMPPMPDYPGRRNSNQDPTKLFNSMIHPLIPYAIRGAIWYQGESNGGEGMSYFESMQALVGGWRELWRQGDFPFYYVQLPGWQTSDPDSPAGADGWARCREAQRRSLGIPNTGMAITLDLGDAKNIHPLNKQDVGLRLALLALNRTFKHDIVHSGPLYAGMAIEGHAIRIRFDHVGSGLMIGEKTGLDPVKELPDGQVKWVAIAGADMQWHWADMKIDGDSVLVSSEAVPDPVAVRYAYTANPVGPLLYNREGLPASPFTTEEKWQ